MERLLEQQYAIKFCVRLGKNATETFQMLQKAFKDDCISRSQSGKWHKVFKEGREEVADEPRSGRPTTARTDENMDRVLEVLRTDRRLSIQQISDTLHMSTFVVNRIVTEDLQMRLESVLDKNLSGQWIGRRGPIEFPARSPDLTPLDFFLWGTVKDGVYKCKPRNLDILWNEIQAVCREISLDVLIRCTESVVTRTQNCIDAAGHQIEQY
ncbi:hypothetical protein LAZ67_5000890 [Cordylochernes scorpioides]|uniref:Mos1 transposase HTH domain-containing protein n=1 Tax=Cordylochernes scorpioides TaxID=51811 RepID=A0ABY6KF75_9ARAC|nr:hypothetical protein LAZ67_5000890 [Cordylochernes scorpioides]